MSKAGQHNYKGVNTQAKSALLLFLTHYYGSDFTEIVLEDEQWEDYTLKFKSGKSIVCESKAWDKPISLGATLDILENIAKRETKLNKKDEIFIVCSKTDPRLVKDLEYLRYELPLSELASFKGFRKPKKLTPEIIELLKITKFFELPSGDDESKDYLESEMLARFAHLIPFWLPEKEMKHFMNSVLIEQIYNKSEAGKTFTKSEFEALITSYRNDKIKNTGAFDSQKRAITKQMNTIVQAIKNKDEKYQIEGENLIALSAQPMHMYIALDLISQQAPLRLKDWGNIWEALIDKSYGFRVIHIFERSINSKANASFIIRFLRANIDMLNSPLVDRHNQEYAIDLLSKVVKAYPVLSNEALSYLKDYVKPRLQIYTDTLSGLDLSYEKENIAKVLTEIYQYGKETSSQELIDAVINFISDTFNVAEDDSEHSLLTPSGAYSILKDWLSSDFYKNFPKLREF
jgi:TATA-box binding protein (TBP) (component of TFIID and TFIIIB)